MKLALRILLAIVLGLALAFMLLAVVEWFSNAVYPNPTDIRKMGEHVRQYPAWILAVVVPAWSATAAAVAWVSTRVGNRYAGGAVALILALALVLNLMSLPYAMWFKVVMFCALPIACFLGIKYGGMKFGKLAKANSPSGAVAAK